MRSTVLYAPGDVRVEDRDNPKILAPSDAIIRMSATCVCGSDLWPYRGIEAVQGPVPIGHEYVGIVEEVGDDVRAVRPGQFVVVAAWKDKSAWDAHMASAGTKEFRDKLNALRNAPADDRFHNALSVGPMEVAFGSLYGVTHVDVIPPQKDNAIVALKVLGEANRAAAGNVRFEIVQQTNRPNHFTVFEIWRSREAFDVNGMSAHQREFRDKLAGMAGALYDERLYETLN